MILRLSALIALVWLASTGKTHTVITYPGWRGNNLITNDTWPYGMQWMYPCGGLSLTTNRTLWPVSGGTISVQPGWFQGHALAFFRINMGLDTSGPDGGPLSMDIPLLDLVQVVGPSNNPYPGTLCFPNVPVPANASVKVGDNATLQVILTAQHGASLFACADITFAEPEKVPVANSSTCFNSSDISFNEVYTMAAPPYQIPL